MPKFDQNLENFTLPSSHYGFSGVRIGDDVLGATEYTLVTIVLDNSGSVHSFKDKIDKAVGEVVKSCQKSPRKDNLMLRVLTFNDVITEFHGFKLLMQCDVKDYDNISTPGGMTALQDAAMNAISATRVYGQQLVDHYMMANGIIVVITDGEDNRSITSKPRIKQEIETLVKDEVLESCVNILVGINTSAQAGLSANLQQFQTETGFSQYVDIDNADEKSIARLADFVSRSISSQSQSLGSGGPSISLVF